MKILYIDTSSNYLYTAIYNNNDILCEVKQKMDNKLSAYALPKIAEMFNNHNISINKLDKIIAVNGPGSFTGIRIGLTIAKTIAWSLNIPIIQISSLEAMALSSNLSTNYAVPVIDARRGYVYGSIYDVLNKNFVMKEQYILFSTLEAAISNINDTICLISNDKFDTSYEIIDYNPNIKKIVETAMSREPINPHAVDANYLKITEAEENKLKEEKNDC